MRSSICDPQQLASVGQAGSRGKKCEIHTHGSLRSRTWHSTQPQILNSWDLTWPKKNLHWDLFGKLPTKLCQRVKSRVPAFQGVIVEVKNNVFNKKNLKPKTGTISYLVQYFGNPFKNDFQRNW